MGRRILSLLFLVAGVWTAIEIYTHGTAGAFGGALARLGVGGGSHVESTLARVRGSATGARDRQLERLERQLGEGSVGLQDRSADILED